MMNTDREALLYATGYADGRRHLTEDLEEQAALKRAERRRREAKANRRADARELDGLRR